MDPRGPGDLPYRAGRWLLRAGARLGPASWREKGLQEWEAELWALRRRGCGTGELMRFAASGAAHALWRRRQEGWGMIGLTEDLRLATRRLARTPGFTGVAVLILALGIGANTALFGALQQALRGAARYPDADRLVVVDLMLATSAAAAPDTFPWSYPKFLFARERIRSVGPLAAFAVRGGTLTGAGDATRLAMEMVSPPYFELIGEEPLIGRTFDPSEDPPAEGAVALLGHALWSERFGGDPGVVGRTVTIDGATLEVIGVMRPGFRGLTGRAELWLPIAGFNALGTPGRLRQPWSHWHRVVGRLDRGTSLAQARDELATVGVALTEAYPDPEGGGAHGMTAVPLLGARVNPIARTAVAAVSLGGALLLLIACANVAGLLLARASARRTDVAVRAALGAGRVRLARESLAESVLLAGAGGVAGVALAWLGQGAVARSVRYALETSGTRTLQYLDPDALRLDGTALALGAALALLVGIVAGLLPLRATFAPDLTTDLKAGSAGGFARSRTVGETGRGLLVTAQLALTLVLLTGAGLMASSFAGLSGIPLGFANRDVLVLRFEGGPSRSDAEAHAYEAQLLARVQALPGVRSVGTALCPPLSQCDITGVRRIDGGPSGGGNTFFSQLESILTSEVSPDYFTTLGVRVLAGRGLDAGVRPEEPPQVVVNETAARKLFGGNAVGHRIEVTHRLTDGVSAEVVGVVEDVRYGGLEEEMLPAIYFSRTQAPSPYGTLLVHTSGDPEALLEAVRAEARAIASDVPLTDATTLRDMHAGATARTRVLLWLLAAFSALGLLLSAVGIYGVVSYDVLRRRRDTGLRLALGASRSRVAATLVSRPARFAIAGAALGIFAAVGLTRELRALLFGVEPGDPRVLAAAGALLVLVAAASAWIPTRRALGLDPAATLRGE